MLYPTLAEQFARRQRDWKPNMNIVPTDPYLVDGVRTGSMSRRTLKRAR